MEKKKITFVTQNKNKLASVQSLLPHYEVEHIDFEITEIQSLDPKEVARHKLETAYAKIQKPCFVIDTSLEIAGLGGFPGPLIKWFWESMGLETMAKIVTASGDTNCTFTNILGYHDGQNLHYFENKLAGTIPSIPRGTNGYAWDPVFIPEGSGKTFAEMSFEEKHQYKMTTKLLEDLEAHINKYN